LQREYLLGSVLKNLPQFGDFHPPDIPYFVVLGDWLSIFHLAQEDKPHPWEPTLELLLTAEGDKGKAIVILRGIGLGTDIGIETSSPVVLFLPGLLASLRHRHFRRRACHQPEFQGYPNRADHDQVSSGSGRGFLSRRYALVQ
jgi:hypothetical protein